MTAENGTVIGAGEYNHGAEVTLTATPNTGYHFVKWSDGVTDATRTITVTNNVTLTAEFAMDTYQIVLIVDEERGRVVGSGTYKYGSIVTLVALANTHYHFVKWSDGDINDVRTIVVTDNITLTAEFAPNMYDVVLNVDAKMGRVVGSGSYEYGTSITIIAIPNSGYEFVRWSDGDINDIRTITVEGNLTLTAEFKEISIGTEVEENQAEKMIVYTQNQTLYVEGIEDNYYVLDMTGNVIYYGQSPIVTLPCGVYVVVNNGEYQKIIIR